MKTKRTALCFIVLFCLTGLLFIPVFIVSALKDQYSGELDNFELIARVIGYVMVLVMEVFSVLSAMCIVKEKSWVKHAKTAVIISLVMVAVLSVHDILLYADYGNQLEGTFSMTYFFAMDIILLFLYCIVVAMWNKEARASVGIYALFGIAVVWVLYMIADMAGYPSAQLWDWDEAMLKFVPMCNAVFVGLIKLLQINSDKITHR